MIKITFDTIKIGKYNCIIGTEHYTGISNVVLSKLLKDLDLTIDDLGMTKEFAESYEESAYEMLGEIGDALTNKHKGYIFDMEETYHNSQFALCVSSDQPIIL